MSTVQSLSFKALLKSLLAKDNIVQHLIIAAMLVIVTVIGIGSAIYYKGNNPIEIVAEHILEEQLESTLDLPEGTLDGRINLTPSKA
jgi:hypothetical protein